MDITFKRQAYKDESLNRDKLNPDPFFQFEGWFEDANKIEPIPNAMSLATVCKSGEPTLRTVLLKLFDKNGFVFFTNYNIRKAVKITQNRNLAILFNWIALERQVSIEGVAEKIHISESMKYFLSRPRGSQLGAWVSNQSEIIKNRELIDLKFADFEKKFKGKVVPKPPCW